MVIESGNPQQMHLQLLRSVRKNFQLPNLIWRGDRRGTALFQGQKREKARTSPLLIDLGS